MSYGRTTPRGHLPVFSVGSEREAKRLLEIACERNVAGQHVARELAHEQTLENLAAFSERLEQTHDKYIGDWCDCTDRRHNDARPG